MYWVGRYITVMDTEGCGKLSHIGKSYFCIRDGSIDAFDIVMLCEQQPRNIGLQYVALHTHLFIQWGNT